MITNALLTFSEQRRFALYISLTLDDILVLWIVLLGVMHTELSRLRQIVCGHLSIRRLFRAVHNLRVFPPLFVVQDRSYSMPINREGKRDDPAGLGRTTTSLLPFQFKACFISEIWKVWCLHLPLASWSEILGSRQDEDFLILLSTPTTCFFISDTKFFSGAWRAEVMTQVISSTVFLPGKTLPEIYSRDSPIPLHYGELFFERREGERDNGCVVWTREWINKWILKIFLLQPSTNPKKRGKRAFTIYLWKLLHTTDQNERKLGREIWQIYNKRNSLKLFQFGVW